MGVNIKLPIGLMFSILGILLTIHGLVTDSDTEMYEKSMNINVNLWTGLLMLALAGFMLISLKFDKKARKKTAEEKTSEDKTM